MTTEPPAPPDDRTGVALAIVMALMPLSLYWGRGRKLTLDDKHMLARRILEHLRLSRFVVGELPPIEGHGRRPDP